MTIGCVFALESEFEVFKRHFQGSFSYKEPFYVSDDETYVVIICGVGKSSAAAKTLLLIEKTQPDVVLNIGVAGGVSAQKGTLIIANKVMFHDVDVSAFGYDRGQLPGQPAVFKTPKEALEPFLTAAEALHIPLIKANVATGDQFVTELSTVFPVLETHKKIKAIEMEAAAIAMIATEYNTPFIILKAISDEVGASSQVDDFNVFLDTVMVPFVTLVEHVYA